MTKGDGGDGGWLTGDDDDADEDEEEEEDEDACGVAEEDKVAPPPGVSE